MASTGEVATTDRRRPELDGIRGLAIAMVVIGHAGLAWNWAPFAAAGVTLFFALSGYLITGILVRERDAGDGIKLKRFYARRATRLVPPLAVMLIIISLWSRPDWPAVATVATWTSNYARIAGIDVDVFGHTWSLAVEEQFYVLWPLFLLVTPRRWVIPVCTSVFGALLVWRTGLHLFNVDWYTYHALETSGVSILAGALIALRGWRLPGRWAGLTFAIILAVSAGAALTGSERAWMVVPLLVTVPAAGMVAAADGVRWLTQPVLVFLGVASYSIYLWHAPVGLLVNSGWRWDGILIGAGVGLVAYLLVEQPLMHWRRRRSSAPATAPRAPVPAARD